MQAFAAAVEASAVASFLRQSHWTYPAVNAAHLLGIALLVGAIVPMDLRLMGLWRPDVRLDTVLGLLRPVAAFGAGLAVLTVICMRQTFSSGIGPHHVLLVETEAAAVPVNSAKAAFR